LLLIVEAHEPQELWVETGRIGPIHFLDIRGSDEREGKPVARLRAMRGSDEQEDRP